MAKNKNIRNWGFLIVGAVFVVLMIFGIRAQAQSAATTIGANITTSGNITATGNLTVGTDTLSVNPTVNADGSGSVGIGQAPAAGNGRLQIKQRAVAGPGMNIIFDPASSRAVL